MGEARPQRACERGHRESSISRIEDAAEEEGLAGGAVDDHDEERAVDGVRAVGAERTLFSSDLGNPDYPAVEDGLALWADRLLGSGFDEDAAREMIVGQSRRLAGAE